MGMPITLEIIDSVEPAIFDSIFDYFRLIDEQFSPYRPSSELSRFNRGELEQDSISESFRFILAEAERTKAETEGYFDIGQPGHLDPSGLVKGWAISQAAKQLRNQGMANFYLEAGGDSQVEGQKNGQPWIVGIRHPQRPNTIVKHLALSHQGVATSGTYERGNHIYNPKADYQPATELASLTVIGPDIYDADRYATAAFAMGQQGIYFLEKLTGFEGYAIEPNGQATMTTGFKQFVRAT